MKHLQLILLIAITLLGSAIVHAVPAGAALFVLVQEAEQNGELPQPILELMILDGSELEEATEVTVSTSASGTYAQGFTYHAICMSVSEDQAQRIHDIAINAVSDKYKAGVEAEARYSLTQFKDNGCAAVEDSSNDVIAAEESLVEDTSEEDALVLVELEKDVLEIEERVVTLALIDESAITGTIAGGASNSQ